MPRIVVKEMYPPAAEGKAFVVVDTTGVRMTSFDKCLSDIRPGDILNVETEINGKFTNIKTWELVTPPAHEKKPPNAPQPVLVSEWEKERAHETYLACLQEVGKAIRENFTVADINHPLFELREKYWAALQKGIDGYPVQPQTPVISYTFHADPAVTAPVIPAPELKQKTEEEFFIKNFADLLKEAKDKFKYELKDVMAILEVKYSSDVKDMKAAWGKLVKHAEAPAPYRDTGAKK